MAVSADDAEEIAASGSVNLTGSAATCLTLQGQAIDHAPPFTSTAAYDVSSRTRTAASVAWSPAAWTLEGAAGPEQRTPNLAALIQEIVSWPGWARQLAGDPHHRQRHPHSGGV